MLQNKDFELQERDVRRHDEVVIVGIKRSRCGAYATNNKTLSRLTKTLWIYRCE